MEKLPGKRDRVSFLIWENKERAQHSGFPPGNSPWHSSAGSQPYNRNGFAPSSPQRRIAEYRMVDVKLKDTSAITSRSMSIHLKTEMEDMVF